MLPLTENIAYLWLLPVTIFIVIPLLILAGRMVMSPLKWLFSGPDNEEVVKKYSEEDLQPSEA